MNFYINKLLLFPKKTEKEIRELVFEPNKINVITGKSRTGKSAVSKIIDYCLGSSKSYIPMGTIRDNVEWYGIEIIIDERKLFIARKESIDGKINNDYYIKEGHKEEKLDIPQVLNKNYNLTKFKAKLNNVLQLPDLDLIGGLDSIYKYGKGYDGKPSFRDLISFNYLPQHIVANPNALFYKTDTADYRARLIRLFPFALGAINSDFLLAEHKSNIFKKALVPKQTEFDRRKNEVEAWNSKLDVKYQKAVEIGLISEDFSRPQNVEEYIIIFKKLVSDLSENQLRIDKANIDEAVSQLELIREDEEKTSQRLDFSKRQLGRIKRLTNTLSKYEGELNSQSNRLYSTKWFEEQLNELNECPFCGSENSKAADQLNYLSEATKHLSLMIEKAQKSPQSLNKEEVKLLKQVSELEKNLTDLRHKKGELEKTSEHVSRFRYSEREIFRFIGEIEQSLANLEIILGDSRLKNEIEELNREIQKLQIVINENNKNDRIAIALSNVSSLMRPYIQQMDLEYKEDLPELRISDLSLVLKETNGTTKNLWELGSGENWMGYHITTLLALHQYFMSLDSCPILSFLIIDQPTQVYFPTKDDSYDTDKSKSSKENEIYFAKRIFETLSTGYINSGKNLQIIVTEHADNTTWGDIEHIHEVENWRDGKKLIPSDWYE